MQSDLVVNNLKNMSDAVMKVANKPEIYNTDYGLFLEQFSHQLYRDANDLERMQAIFCDASFL